MLRTRARRPNPLFHRRLRVISALLASAAATTRILRARSLASLQRGADVGDRAREDRRIVACRHESPALPEAQAASAWPANQILCSCDSPRRMEKPERRPLVTGTVTRPSPLWGGLGWGCGPRPTRGNAAPPTDHCQPLPIAAAGSATGPDPRTRARPERGWPCKLGPKPVKIGPSAFEHLLLRSKIGRSALRSVRILAVPDSASTSQKPKSS